MFGSNNLKNELINKINTFFLKKKVGKVKYNNSLIQLPLSQHSQDLDNLTYALENQVNILLIIEEMGLGIFLTNHSAKKLPYIFNLLQDDSHFRETSIFYINKSSYKLHQNPNKWTGARLVIINEKWDTSEWQYNKLVNLAHWITYLNSIIQLELYVPEVGKPLKHCIDYQFLQALGYVIEEVEEPSPPEDN
jgi:hypothetical protein